MNTKRVLQLQLLLQQLQLLRLHQPLRQLLQLRLRSHCLLVNL